MHTFSIILRYFIDIVPIVTKNSHKKKILFSFHLLKKKYGRLPLFKKMVSNNLLSTLISDLSNSYVTKHSHVSVTWDIGLFLWDNLHFSQVISTRKPLPNCSLYIVVPHSFKRRIHQHINIYIPHLN